MSDRDEVRELHELAARIDGALVSIDVSADDDADVDSAYDRVFGRVTGVAKTSAGITVFADYDGVSEEDWLKRRDARVAAEALEWALGQVDDLWSENQIRREIARIRSDAGIRGRGDG